MGREGRVGCVRVVLTVRTIQNDVREYEDEVVHEDVASIVQQMRDKLNDYTSEVLNLEIVHDKPPVN